MPVGSAWRVTVDRCAKHGYGVPTVPTRLVFQRRVVNSLQTAPQRDSSE
jgi:hypothetical protein